MKNIITACYFVAGVDSAGMRQLKTEFEALRPHEVIQRDNLSLDNRTRTVYHFYHHRPNKRQGVRYEGEKDGGEIDLFEERT